MYWIHVSYLAINTFSSFFIVIFIIFLATLSFVHHFKAIGELKLELQSGNAKFVKISDPFLSRVTLKFDGGPSKTIGHLIYTRASFQSHREIYHFQ